MKVLLLNLESKYLKKSRKSIFKECKLKSFN